ncbi:hypothetical protein [Allosalinactinospora lopnorensis]|uniref:hypothetical protein n=1 Tax=Allosalinactinospora lopnorensis TaxID=1352348 RepID=UPI000623BACC|nr:hypothetical protein [Allosalinactinospora lopnorensis]
MTSGRGLGATGRRFLSRGAALFGTVPMQGEAVASQGRHRHAELLTLRRLQRIGAASEHPVAQPLRWIGRFEQRQEFADVGVVQ